MISIPPLVSVLMPIYNCEDYVEEAIESILNQSYQNYEFVIVDDCSNDNTWKIIQRCQKKDERIRSFRNTKNIQEAASRNKLFDLANKSSKYFAIMDGDDVSVKNRLEEQVHFLEKEENRKVGIVGSNLFIIDERSTIIAKRHYQEEITRKSILLKSPIAHPSAMIRREVIENIGNYDQQLYIAVDFELFCRAFELYEIKNIQKNLLKYRISTTQQKYTRLKMTLKTTLKIQRTYFRKYGSVKLILVMLFESFLLLLPKKITILLFKFIVFKKTTKNN